MTAQNVRNVQQEFANMYSCHGNSPVTTIFVLVVKQGSIDDILNCVDYTRHPIIVKTTKNEKDSRLFIDEDGNRYSNWECYKLNNKLGCGIMIAPKNGYYSFDENGCVRLEILETPAAKCSKTSTIRQAQQDFAKNSKSAGENCSSNIIYVLLTNDVDLENAEDSRNFTYHPIIRSKGEKEGEDGTFVDEDGETYKNWECYKKENKLNCGIMVAPLNGYYSFDDDGRVKLESVKTPSTNSNAGITVGLDTPTIQEAQLNYAKLDGRTENENKTDLNVVHILVTTEATINDAISSRVFTTHSVKRTKNKSFIDNHGKEYVSWEIYKIENNLPEGIMVAPLNGIYSLGNKGGVRLEVSLTPSCWTHNDNRTIRNMQQNYAKINKYVKSDTVIIHVMVTSIENPHGLDTTEFKEFCLQRKSFEQAGSTTTCYYFEDENGNEYDSLVDYIRDYNQIYGKVYVPKNGDYTFDANGKVELEVFTKENPQTIAARTVRTVLEIQQDFANNCGFKTEVIWDLLSANQHSILKSKIEKIIPDQTKGQKKVEEMRNIIFESVWAQTEGDSSHCCMVFIDELGRVYQNWKSYVEDNELPAGMMVAPRNGIYTLDANGVVELDFYATPNDGVGRKIIGAADKATAVGGFGAAVVTGVSFALPLAPAVLPVAGAVVTVTAAYSAFRSAFNLFDRNNHEQSISLDNAQARNSWLGVGAGVVGLGAAKATKSLTTAAAAGREISVMTELVVNGMNISSIVLSGSGMASGILDLYIRYRDDEEWSALELAQLATSLVIFTHSVANFRLASTLIKDTHHTTIQDYRKSLSNRQRRMFDKMSKETVRIRGESRGKVDIIRSVNDMPSKQYLNDLYKVNKELNKAKVRPSFASDGEAGVVLNNEVKIDSKVLRNNIQHKQGPNLLSTVKKSIPGTHSEASVTGASRLLLTNNINNSNFPRSKFNAGAIAIGSIVLPNNVIIKLCEYGKRLFEIISNAESFEDIITTLANVYSQRTFHFLMKVAQKFVETKLDELARVLKIFISAESILYRILLICQNKYVRKSFEYISQKEAEIIEALKAFFISLNPNGSTNLSKCSTCNGNYSIKIL